MKKVVVTSPTHPPPTHTESPLFSLSLSLLHFILKSPHKDPLVQVSITPELPSPKQKGTGLEKRKEHELWRQTDLGLQPSSAISSLSHLTSPGPAFSSCETETGIPSFQVRAENRRKCGHRAWSRAEHVVGLSKWRLYFGSAGSGL